MPNPGQRNKPHPSVTQTKDFPGGAIALRWRTGALKARAINTRGGMNKTEKYLAALDPPDPASPAPTGTYWPDAIPAHTEEKPDYPLDYQVLSNGGIEPYLTSLSNNANGHSNGNAQPTPVDFAALDHNWTAETYPLMLCEFLAYKAGLAYRSQREIRHDVIGLDANGRPYRDGIDQFAFFDTSQPHSTVRYADTQAYAFVHEGTGYLIFRGTSSFSDWRTNFSLGLTTETYPHLDTVPQTLVRSAHPARHTGFAVAWGAVAPEVEIWVRDQLHHQRIDKIVLSGHSLGGALAILGAHHFASKQICRVHAVVTFGAPKVGGAEFKTDYESQRLGLKDRTLRIEAADDLVSLVSRRWSDAHVGHEWRFKKRPLRPAWQMLLFSPLIGVQDASKNKIEQVEEEHTQDAAAQPGSGSTKSNAPREEQRTWQQYFMGLVLMALWYLLRTFVHALAAHSVETRYGLFISTLSYRRIRKYHQDHARLIYMRNRSSENERIIDDCAFTAANADLGRHLKVVRGRHPRTFRYLANRPIRVASSAKLASYENSYTNYIA